METVTDFIFLGSKITADGDCSHEIKRHLLLGRKAMTNLDSILKSRDMTLPTKVHLVKAMVFLVLMYGCESEIAQSCPTLCDPIDCSLPGCSVHGIFQAIVLEWIAISFSRGSSQPRARTWASHIVDRRFTVWATREVLWMWELDYKENWVLKNWCFWSVVLEKPPESPLDYKEIQPVHPKGYQSWVFIGGPYVEAETPILWPSDVKSWLIRKDPDAGKDWRWEETGMTEDQMVRWHHQLNGHEFE